MASGTLLHINVSGGGVPKLPVPSARVTRAGVAGDAHSDVTGHGGPHRAVSILGIDAIRRVSAEGHPIAPGTTGENLTVDGFDVSVLPVGTRLAIGDEVVIELASSVTPCRTIRHSFSDLRFGRLSAAAHPADARMYARVIVEGEIRAGDPIRIEPPSDDRAELFTLSKRIDDAERATALAVWQAATASGLPVNVLDDGELAVAAAPALPGTPFNVAFGFANLPDLVDRAIEHFERHGTTGWVWADAAPWPDAILDSSAVYVALPIDAPDPGSVPEGLVVRELERDEVGAWGDVLAAVEETGSAGDAFRRLEPELARSPHHHRFVAELDGRVAGVGSLHTHHGVAWLRAGVVLPAFRGRGIQRALISARLDHARRLGCDLAGACADAGSVSARNLERMSGRVVAARSRYRVEAPVA